jgi:hypothetical protein
MSRAEASPCIKAPSCGIVKSRGLNRSEGPTPIIRSRLSTGSSHVGGGLSVSAALRTSKKNKLPAAFNDGADNEGRLTD